MALTPIDGIVESVIGIAGKVLDRIIPDPAQRAAAALEMAKLQQSGELARMSAETQLAQGQIDIDKIEAAGEGFFKSGWRPFIGWTCGTGLAFQFIVAPIATWAVALAGHPMPFPTLDLGTLMTLLFGMLGLGAYRTYEKTKA
jgi:hypothetical protein